MKQHMAMSPGLLITLTAGQSAPIQHLLSGPGPDCGQGRQWQNKVSLPQDPPPQGNSHLMGLAATN